MTINFLHLFILISAVWRVSSLFANEKGPWHIFKKFRELCARLCERYKLCSEFHLYELVECEWCNSVWFGMMFTAAWFAIGDVFLLIILPLTVSTWVIVIKFVVQPLEQLNSYMEIIRKEKGGE